MKTKNKFIISSLIMWFVLVSALSMSAKDFYLLEINNEANAPIKVTVFDAKRKAHEYRLGKTGYKSETILNKEGDTYSGFGAEGSKFIVEVEDPGYKKFKKEYAFTGQNMEEIIELERAKDVMGIPTSNKINMKVDINPEVKIYDQNAPGYPKPLVGSGAVKITFNRPQVE